MARRPVRARYGWWKTILIFAVAGGVIGVATDAVFPHDHSASSITFAVVLAVVILIVRPFEPVEARPQRR